MAIYKNKASQKIIVYAHDTAADAPKTGDAANITAYISKDGAAMAATNDANPTELDATNGKGLYVFDMLQAETNADMIALSPVSATENIEIEPVIIYTEPTIRQSDLTQILTDAQSATDLKDFADAGYDPATNSVEQCKVNDDMVGTDSALTTLGTNAPAGWVNAAAIGADAITAAKIADGAFVAANFAASSLDGKGDWNTTAPDNANIVNIHNVVKSGGTGDCAAILADTDDLQGNQSAWATATGFATASDITTAHSTTDDAIAVIDAITDKLNTAMVLDGAVYQFTANALELAPSGTGASAASIAEAMFTYDATADYSTADSGSVVKQIATNASGSGLTAQQTRDAMTLAPTPGTPVAGSIDADLDIIVGTDGVTLATDQANYAPNKVVPLAAATSQTEHDATQTAISNLVTPPTVGEITADIDANSTQLDSISGITDKLNTALVLDGAVYQFTANALELGPTGSGASAADIADAVWDEVVTSGHTTTGSAGKLIADGTWNTATSVAVASIADDAITAASIADNALNGKGDWNTTTPLNAAEVRSECDDALTNIHLDHLLAVDYDPASKPGAPTALFNELIESDAGISRYTVNALENGPSGSGSSAEVIAQTVWAKLTSEITTADSIGKYFLDLENINQPVADGVVWEYTVIDDDSNPIPDTTVMAKYDGAFVQSRVTDVSGVASFFLSPETYDFYSYKVGYNFTNPDTEIVS